MRPIRTRRAVGVGVCVLAAVAAGVGSVLWRSGPTTPAVGSGPPHFVEEARAAGVDQVFDGGSDYFTGGGLAVLDCNGDGRPDLYVAGGGRPATLYRNVSAVGGALRFTAVHDPATDLARVNGAYPLDIDGDGNVDLAVLRFGETVLLRGLGDCRFERANEHWGFDGGNAWAAAFSATWEGTATLPTLAIGHYLGIDASGASTLDCDRSQLLRPTPAGTGYAAPIMLAPGYCSLSMLFSDWDRSGRRDLRISNDSNYYNSVYGEEQLWRVAPGEAPRLYTEADGWVRVQIQGMGIASYDVTGDGYPDVFLTSQAANRLQMLTAGPGQPAYRDIGLKAGVNAAHPFAGDVNLPSTAWHPEFEDVNNDGIVDLFISKGNVSTLPDYAMRDPSNLLIGQPDGTFVEGAQAAGLLSFARGRGAALADFNLDGMLDLVQSNYGDPLALWRNVGAGDASHPAPLGNWLALRITQPAPNRDAIGAWLEVRSGDATTRRELNVGAGHISGQLGWIHVGLGASTSADVRVQWPDGSTGPWIRVAANQFATLSKGAGDATHWQPPAN